MIVTLKPGWDASSEVKKLGGKLGRRLGMVSGQVVELSNGQLRRLADHPGVASIYHDRPTRGAMSRAATTVGARAVRQEYGYTGAGIGVAVIDSGITDYHNDLTGPHGVQRVARFVDFVQGRTSAYDDFGHGTHVAGIIAGNGKMSYGAHAGIAPSASLVSLKVLDGTGAGVISDVIAAIEYAVANKSQFNIRVINLSVGASVTTSYWNDPLALAAKRAVDAGIVVVAAAGNRGRNAAGQTQYGGITAPGNAPWVLTVGASNSQGTVVRYDDTIGSFSSRGPSAIDFQAKPDLVAPGTGIVSLSDPLSLFYVTKPGALLGGSLFGTKPYLSLSGTSMAAPVVSGTVALMLQANPSLTPNLVKAILQYTAQDHGGYDPLTQGAGFLNTKGAVDLARFYATAAPGEAQPTSRWWSRRVIWGNQRLGAGIIQPTASAWSTGVVWGAASDAAGDNIVWGTLAEADNIVWGTSVEADNIVWGTAAESDNIVWGTDCGGRNCDNIVWGTFDLINNIVWGTAVETDNIVWGTAAEADNIVWGTSDEVDNIVWGTAAEADNIVWGTSAEDDNIVWGTAGLVHTLWTYLTTSASMAFELLFVAPMPPPSPPPPLDPVLQDGAATMIGGTVAGGTI